MGAKTEIDPLVAAIDRHASSFADYGKGIDSYWKLSTCGCVKKCQPKLLGLNERCVNNYRRRSVSAGEHHG